MVAEAKAMKESSTAAPPLRENTPPTESVSAERTAGIRSGAVHPKPGFRVGCAGRSPLSDFEWALFHKKCQQGWYRDASSLFRDGAFL